MARELTLLATPALTDEMVNLRTLLEKSSDADLLREMVGFAAQRLMELEVASLGRRRAEAGPVPGVKTMVP